ncbi:SRPBCC family protein [Muricauda sp. JGD-17]|uniref:SRPBCC family protein n=1 Tax=Flagellimonas ochracea TaxID=2696472 RepID=A0A964TFI5_9FLAO|nr:SRPBCC family protein [Allomuricauda ochracea]NAY93303.1 SRPBCC family protein [Allomuricauda ochracea]
MQYTVEILVHLPRDEFVKKLDDPENMKHWQNGLLQYEHLSGVPGEEGAQMSLSYNMGNRNVDMVETIIKRNFPHELHASYDTKGVQNIQKNYFEEVDGKTLWKSDNIFKFSSFMMKLIGILMPGAFKKQTMKYLNDFKAFAENGTSVMDS